MNPVEKKIIDTFLLLIKKKLSVHRIELFGSRARGDADPDSDMDLLVIVNDLSPEVEDY
ncbi:MAG: nucleotidyltransferase domain-containing protein, partial [Deltaproteobacteria bacterium]|nr:nucleotidyltransferase domain-containing protein [Deltaproteobacteria bacterium]